MVQSQNDGATEMTPAQQITLEHVQSWLKELFGSLHIRRLGDGSMFEVSHNSAVVRVAVKRWDEQATIHSRAVLAYGPDLTSDLPVYLLKENALMRFGAFGVDREGNVFFGHTTLGNEADREGFESSVLAVAEVASQYDSYIVEHWGGQTAREQADLHRRGGA